MRSENNVEEQEHADVERENRGRPDHVPTDQNRAIIQLLAGFRTGQQDIARCLKMSINTLRKHYMDDLITAQTKIDAVVLNAWYKNVKAGKEMTILRYLENRFKMADGTAGVATALPTFIVADDIPKEIEQAPAVVGPGPVIDVEPVEAPQSVP